MALRDSVVAVVTGKLKLEDVHAAFGTAPRTVQRYIEKLPADVVDCEGSLALTRAASKLCRVRSRHQFTDSEMRAALVAVHNRTMSACAAELLYGPDHTTIAKHLSRLRELAKSFPDDKIEDLAEGMSFARGGAHTYFTPDETKFMLLHASAMGDVGEPTSVRAVCARARECIMQLAEKETDPRRKEWLQRATVTKNWYKRAIKKYGKELNIKPKLVKTKGLSIRRAAANQVGLTKEMFDRITKMYAEHRAAGVLKTEVPDGEQVPPPPLLQAGSVLT